METLEKQPQYVYNLKGKPLRVGVFLCVFFFFISFQSFRLWMFLGQGEFNATGRAELQFVTS